jgi:hypothetical protein
MEDSALESITASFGFLCYHRSSVSLWLADKSMIGPRSLTFVQMVDRERAILATMVSMKTTVIYLAKSNIYILSPERADSSGNGLSKQLNFGPKNRIPWNLPST